MAAQQPLQAVLPFVPLDLVVPDVDTEILLLSLSLPSPSVLTAQILFAAEPVKSQDIHTVAPVEVMLRYTDLSDTSQEITLARVAKLPFESLQMRGKHESFIATEKTPVGLWVRFKYPIPSNDSGKPVHFKAFVGAFIRQQPL